MTRRQAIILGGGNIGLVASRLDEAERLLRLRVGEVVAHSSLHRSEAWGFHSPQEFLNRAFVVETQLDAEALLDALQGIERELGRNRESEEAERQQTGERYASRKIDLDLLFFGDEHIDTERLQVPHPLIMEREFVLAPLCEVCGLSREQIGKRIETITGKY